MRYGQNPLRRLARSNKWQIIYARAKETSGIKLFNNESDFSKIQTVFLQWLEIYHSLEVDLAMKEPFITREIIEKDLRCDAYLLWRHLKKRDFDKNKDKEQPIDNLSGIPTIRFKGKK